MSHHHASTLTTVFAPVAPHVETMRVERPRAKSSSERGKAFRARRKGQQAALVVQNQALARHVRALVERKALFDAQFVRAAHTPAGSRERLVREYYKVFDRGYRACACAQWRGPHACQDAGASSGPAKRALLQSSFVMQAIDEDARVGDAQGRQAVIDQWRIYTAAHRKYEGRIQSVTFLGSDDAGVVVVHSKVVTGISRLTLETMFPHVLVDKALTSQLEGLDVVYDCTARFAFTSDGRVASVDVDIDFIGGLQRAGVALLDVSRLLGMMPMDTAAK